MLCVRRALHPCSGAVSTCPLDAPHRIHSRERCLILGWAGSGESSHDLSMGQRRDEQLGFPWRFHSRNEKGARGPYGVVPEHKLAQSLIILYVEDVGDLHSLGFGTLRPGWIHLDDFRHVLVGEQGHMRTQGRSTEPITWNTHSSSRALIASSMERCATGCLPDSRAFNAASGVPP